MTPGVSFNQYLQLYIYIVAMLEKSICSEMFIGSKIYGVATIKF